MENNNILKKIICDSCNEEITTDKMSGQLICPDCGNELDVSLGVLICPDCGDELEQDSNNCCYCSECNYEVTEEEIQNKIQEEMDEMENNNIESMEEIVIKNNGGIKSPKIESLEEIANMAKKHLGPYLKDYIFTDKNVGVTTTGLSLYGKTFSIKDDGTTGLVNANGIIGLADCIPCICSTLVEGNLNIKRGTPIVKDLIKSDGSTERKLFFFLALDENARRIDVLDPQTESEVRLTYTVDAISGLFNIKVIHSIFITGYEVNTTLNKALMGAIAYHKGGTEAFFKRMLPYLMDSLILVKNPFEIIQRHQTLSTALPAVYLIYDVLKKKFQIDLLANKSIPNLRKEKIIDDIWKKIKNIDKKYIYIFLGAIVGLLYLNREKLELALAENKLKEKGGLWAKYHKQLAKVGIKIHKINKVLEIPTLENIKSKFKKPNFLLSSPNGEEDTTEKESAIQDSGENYIEVSNVDGNQVDPSEEK